MHKLLFDVTLHVPKTGDVERKSIIAPNDVIARDRAVKAYVKESEVWCEIKFVREIDG